MSTPVSVAGLLLLAALFVGGCAKPRSPLDAHVAYDASPAIVPFERTRGDLPIVQAQSTHGQVPMLLDTGCNAVVFDPWLALREQMPLVRIDARSSDFGGHRHRDDGFAPVKQLSLGTARFYDFYCIVSDSRNMGEKQFPPSAIAGLPMFRETLLTIDYPHNRLLLENGALGVPDGKEILPLVVKDEHLSVPLGHGQRVMWAFIDTGFAGFLTIPRDQIQDFPGAEKKLTTRELRGLYGTTIVDYAQLNDDITLGHHTICKPIVAVGDQPLTIIGAQFLKQFIVTIDQRNQRIRFASADGQPLVIPALGPRTKPQPSSDR